MSASPEIEAIVAKLSKAQREELLDMGRDPLIVVRTLVARALQRKGLCVGQANGPGYCAGEFALTPTGLAVRTHLMESK